MTSVSWGGTTVITPNEDAIKEVKVITNNYDAENGRYRGAQVQIISQNGTNDLRGSAFFKVNRPGLNAFQNYNGYGRALQKDTALYNDIGGTVGGPILRNKLFGVLLLRDHPQRRRQHRPGLVSDAAVHGARGAPGQRRRAVPDLPGLLARGRQAC